jgi:hypothetical protein
MKASELFWDAYDWTGGRAFSSWESPGVIESGLADARESGKVADLA